MTLKDWKQTQIGKITVEWTNRKTYSYITVHVDHFPVEKYIKKGFKEIWSVNLHNDSGKMLMDREFKLKPQALKFAKSYMRTH